MLCYNVHTSIEQMFDMITDGGGDILYTQQAKNEIHNIVNASDGIYAHPII